MMPMSTTAKNKITIVDNHKDAVLSFIRGENKEVGVMLGKKVIKLKSLCEIDDFFFHESCD